MRVQQIDQLLKAVPRTQTGTYRVTMGTLARELGVSRNTIKDDIALLETFNAPIEYDAKRRTLYYREPFDLHSPVWLKSNEALALIVATRLASRSRSFPVGNALVRAIERISPKVASTTSFGPFEPTLLDPVVSTSDSAIREDEADNFTQLCEAIVEKREVRLVYHKAKNESAPETRVVHPLHWLVRPDACMLILHEPALNERRSFELARIREVTFTGATFAGPKGFVLKKYLAGAFGRFIGEPVHAVRVAFDREYVPFVRERPWQPDQHLVERTDGSAEATYQVCHTADLEQNILRAGGQVEVIDPPEVRERIRAAAAKVIARHK
jgi:predicted DNA-binding transcriptional regulator YafY